MGLKCRLTILTGLWSVTGCTPAGISVSVSIDQRATRTIAVLDLEWSPPEAPPKEAGVWTVSAPEAGQAVADQLCSLLIGIKGYKLVERTQLRKVLEEHDLEMADIIARGEYRRLGRLVGADSLVIGQVTAYSVGGWGPFTVATAAFGARMVDVDSGEVLWIINGSRKLDWSIEPARCVGRIIRDVKPTFRRLLRKNRPKGS